MGRFMIKLWQGRDIHKHTASRSVKAGKEAKLNVFCEFKVSAMKKGPVKKSEVVKGQTMFPEFNGQTVFFNLFDPKKMLKDGELPLLLRVWNKGGFSNDLLGETAISMLPFFEGLEPEKEWYKLTWMHKKSGQQQAAGQIELEIWFEPVCQGTLVLTAFDGRNLKNMDSWGKQDPYLKFTFGKNKANKRKGRTSRTADRTRTFRRRSLSSTSTTACGRTRWS